MPLDRTATRSLRASARSHLALLASLALIGAACGGEPEHRPPGMTGPPTQSVCPPADRPSYQGFGQSFMQKYCLRCHSEKLDASKRKAAPLNVNFDSLELIHRDTETVDRTAAIGPAATNRSMPPDSPAPSDDERRKLGQWLACGAPM